MQFAAAFWGYNRSRHLKQERLEANMPGSKVRQEEPNVTVVELTGHLNRGNELMSLENSVKRLIEESARKLVFNVTRLEYIDSAGIGMRVACNGQIERAGGHMRVAGAQGTVAKAFEIVHMDRITSLDADVASALGNLSAGGAGA